jgi:serine/threonine protein kinase
LALTDPLKIHLYANESDVPYHEVQGGIIASGSFGVVYKVRDIRIGTIHAVKEIKKVSSKQIEAVRKELSMLQRCDHPNIISILDAYQVADNLATFFLVNDPWAPYTLSGFLHQSDLKRRAACPWFSQNSTLTEKHITRIFNGLADGLEYLHQKSIKHKDIKPENILLYNAGPGIIRPIIADLGISKFFKAHCSTDYYKGTYAYLAPEQIESVESTLKADIWQLGCCFALILAVFRHGSRGCNQLWNSFENSDVNCSCNIARESFSFMKAFKDLCGEGSPSQCFAHWIVTAMLEKTPALRFDIQRVKRELSELLSMV